MKKTIIIFSISLIFNFNHSQTKEQEFLIDFGPNDIINGNATTNPDSNGNYWNNFINPVLSSQITLSNSVNTLTSYTTEVTTNFLTNGILNGGLLAPNSALIGDLAIATATQDYFYATNKSTLEFKNLNVNRGYEFKIFASRNTTSIRETKYNFIGLNDFKDILQTSGTDIGGNGYHGNTSIIFSSGIIFPDCNGTIKLEVIEESGNFAYLNLIQLTEYSDVAYTIDSRLRIAYMGSSVATGWNAVSDHGYAYQYGELLSDRYVNNSSVNDWEITNISIPGNSTTDVMSRWNDHLVPECNKYNYVVYALSLGNEDVKTEGITAFNRFRDNLLTLITNATNAGMTPIIANTYPSRQYDATEYNFLKQINLLIHQWDVPSINLLGGLDDGTGKWVNGYWDDDWHPNTIGHTELMYTLVPSLFDALDSGKAQPSKISNTYLEMGSSVTNNQLVFTPQNTIHSFTNSFDIKTNSTGNIAAFTTSTGDVGYLSIDGSGYLKYTSPAGIEITGSTIVNDNQWHKITFVHYYARGKSFFYTDKAETGNHNEQLLCDHFYLHPLYAPTTVDYRDWFFYRSAMTGDEVDGLNDGLMLKSSLELYTPLDGQAIIGIDPFVNLAQSTNTVIQELATTLGIKTSTKSKPFFKAFPNPITNTLNIVPLTPGYSIHKMEIINALGQRIKTKNNSDTKEIDFKNLDKGLYFIVIHSENEQVSILKIVKN